jgi:uncharacterized membrane protein
MKTLYRIAIVAAFFRVVLDLAMLVTYGVQPNAIVTGIVFAMAAAAFLHLIAKELGGPSRDERRRQVIERARIGSESDRAAIDRDQSPEAAKRHDRNRFN